MGDSIYKPLIDSMTWSYSRLKSFDNCRYEWYLKYLYGEEPVQNFYASYGSYVHKLIERFYQANISRQDLTLQFLTGFSYSVEGRRPKPEIVEKYIDAGVSYFSSFEPFPYKMVAVEDKIEFDIDDRKFLGFIDFLGEDDGGDLVIIDHKSRDLKPRSGRAKPTVKDVELDEFLTQLYLYSFGVQQKYGRLPKWLCFNCFKSGTFIKEPFCNEAFESAKQWALKTIDKIEQAEKFYPNLDWFYCTNLCGFKNQCCYYESAFGR